MKTRYPLLFCLSEQSCHTGVTVGHGIDTDGASCVAGTHHDFPVARQVTFPGAFVPFVCRLIVDGRLRVIQCAFSSDGVTTVVDVVREIMSNVVFVGIRCSRNPQAF